MISFSREIKEEIALSIMSDSQQKALLLAIMKINGTLSLSSEGLSISIRTENAKIASKIHQILKNLYQPEIEFKVSRKMKLKKNNVYLIKLNKAREILEDLEILSGIGLSVVPSKKILFNEDTKRAYLAGVFLASGSINHPQTSNYHLEMSCQDEEFGEYLISLLEEFEIHAKSIKRRNKYTIYLKSSEKIGDFLRVIGAFNGLMSFETIRIDRDFVNSINRLENCEIANEVKTITASQNQTEDILYIIEIRGMHSMDEKTQQVALLRLEYPDKSLNELCDIYNQLYIPSITKSGMNHRFRKIREMANSLKEKQLR